MVKVKFTILSAWNTEIYGENDTYIKAKGIQFQYDISPMTYTIYIPIEDLNMGKIKKVIKEHYKTHVFMDEYAGLSGEIDTEEGD